LYVGSTPAFDACLSGICTSRQPSNYLLGYLPEFHAPTKVASLYGPDQIATLAAAGGDFLQYTIQSIVKEADAGWIVGDGSQYDPCIDSNAPRNVIIAFSVFGALLLLLVLDGCLVGFAKFDFFVWVLPSCFKDRRRGWWQSIGGVRNMGQGMPRMVKVVVLVFWHLACSAAIVLDITFDIILITQLVPLTVGYVLLGLLCASALAVGLATHLYLLASTGRKLSQSSKDISHLASSSPLVRLYLKLNMCSDPVVLLSSLLLVPLLAALFDVVHVILGPISALLMAFKSCSSSSPAEPQLPVLLGALESSKLLGMRSFITMILQSWPSVAITTWGYLALHKYAVGRVITPLVFLVNLGTSLTHTLIALWCFKDLLVKHGSVTKAFRDMFDLGPVQAEVLPGVNGSPIKPALSKNSPSDPAEEVLPPLGSPSEHLPTVPGPIVEVLPAPGPSVERLPEP
jgi:hypothetical protein